MSNTTENVKQDEFAEQLKICGGMAHQLCAEILKLPASEQQTLMSIEAASICCRLYVWLRKATENQIDEKTDA